MEALSKADLKRRDEITDDLREKIADLIFALAQANTAFEETLRPAIEAYNEAVRAASGWAEDMVRTMDEYRDGRSDAWRESDAGEAYDNWMNEWQGIDLAEAQIPTLNELADIVAGDDADNLENLPVEPDDA